MNSVDYLRLQVGRQMIRGWLDQIDAALTGVAAARGPGPSYEELVRRCRRGAALIRKAKPRGPHSGPARANLRGRLDACPGARSMLDVGGGHRRLRDHSCAPRTRS